MTDMSVVETAKERAYTNILFPIVKKDSVKKMILDFSSLNKQLKMKAQNNHSGKCLQYVLERCVATRLDLKITYFILWFIPG